MQFISCAPRRREETKRFESFNGLKMTYTDDFRRPTVLKPASDASYSSPTTYNEAAASTTSKTDHVLRRGSTGMDQRLKSYHLGEGEGKAVSVRSDSLPTAYAVGTISPISPLPLPTSLVPENPQPWTNSKFGSQITNMAPGWRPVHFGGTQRPNSRQGEDPVELSLESYSRNDPPLVSPKTISASIAYPIQDAFSALSYTDMLHSSGMPYGTEFEIPECSMADSRPQSHSPPMTNTSSPFGFRSKTPLLPQGLNQSLSSTHHIPKGLLQSQLRQTTDLFTQRRGSDHVSSQNVTVPRDEEVPIYNNSRSFPTQIPRQATKVPQSHSASSSSQMLPPDTNTRTPDVLRNPSLYTIPAWPSSTMQTLPLTPLNNPKSHTNLPSMVCRGYQIVNNGQFDSNPKRPYPNLQIQTPLTGSVSQYQVQLETSNGNEDQPPRKKVRHRHAQNLYVNPGLFIGSFAHS